MALLRALTQNAPRAKYPGNLRDRPITPPKGGVMNDDVRTPALPGSNGVSTAVASTWDRIRPWLIGLVALGLAAGVLQALRNLLAQVRYEDILKEIAATPTINLFWAIVATALSFLALSGYDASGLRYIGVRIKRSSLLLTSFIAYALGNTIGLGVLTGGAVRMRLYAAAGIEPGKIAALIAFNAGAFGLGMMAFGAAGLLWGAADVAAVAHLPAWLLRLIAGITLGGVGAFIALCLFRRNITILGRWELRLPPAKLALTQLLISALDLAATAAVLWVLLPADVVGLPTFVVFFVIGIALGVISHVPGGIGVFEATILLACAGRAPPGQIAGALVLYRAIYYLLPLSLAAILLAVYELRSGAAAPVGRAAVKLSPMLLAALTLIGGAMLLISGVTPATDDAADLLSLHVPLTVVEAAHLIGSIAGVAMLFVARGLLSRMDAAWWAALILSLLAGFLAIPKGIAVSEAALLGLLATLLVISRKQFDRTSALFALTFERGWWLSIALVLAVCIWLLFFVYQDVAYTDELWWQFEFNANAPRSLRALMGVALTVLVVALWQMFREPKGRVSLPAAADIDRAAAIVNQQFSAETCLALVGDKSLLFSQSGKAFIMFGKRGRSWVSLFDPVGPRSEWPELVWRFIEMADVHGGRAAFYQVRPQSLSLYLDAGLRAFKLGEEAHVPLADFSLKGPRRANLRQSVNRAEREGLSFEVLQLQLGAAALTELRAVSNEWLSAQNTREKGFSLGAFNECYIVRQPVAVVRRQERIVAFATLLCTSAHVEASVDLMRHVTDMPAGTMDFLFARLLLHFQAAGYQRFGLGMAPMSGMASHELAPRWHRLGRFAFERGERFYNFRGLRSFKQKFDPVWEARYLAAPGGLAPLFALADIAALISGGFKGVITK
jgi:phosphatidylglycerol lysyltransferase